MTAFRIGPLLDGLTEIQSLTRQVRRLRALQHQLRTVLPADLSASISVASLADGRLVLVTENGAAAAKLRHLAPNVLRVLAQRDPDVTAIHVRVQVTQRVNPLPQKRKSVGPKGRAALQALARQLPPSALRRAIRHLAATGAIASENEQESFEGEESQKDNEDE